MAHQDLKKVNVNELLSTWMDSYLWALFREMKFFYSIHHCIIPPLREWIFFIGSFSCNQNKIRELILHQRCRYAFFTVQYGTRLQGDNTIKTTADVTLKITMIGTLL